MEHYNRETRKTAADVIIQLGYLLSTVPKIDDKEATSWMREANEVLQGSSRKWNDDGDRPYLLMATKVLALKWLELACCGMEARLDTWANNHWKYPANDEMAGKKISVDFLEILADGSNHFGTEGDVYIDDVLSIFRCCDLLPSDHKRIGLRIARTLHRCMKNVDHDDFRAHISLAKAYSGAVYLSDEVALAIWTELSQTVEKESMVTTD